MIDDEPLARDLLRSYCERTPGLCMDGEYESAADAMKKVMSETIDLVFLDINLPLLNGIEFAEIIPSRTRIIYVTAYSKYALDGFRVNALDYLLKPVSYTDFLNAVGKAVEWFSMKDFYQDRQNVPFENDTITVKSDYRLVQMKTDSILYIEVRKDRLIFVRTDGEDVNAVMSMRDIEEILPASKFMRVHRSFIVNFRNVEVVERSRIVFGNTYIPISDSKKEEFFRKIGVSVQK